MKISKHLHSCLLIEDAGKTFLIDPGMYTYDAKALDISKLEKLDYILITHEHPDHMHIPFIADLLVKFPAVKILSNPSVVDVLAKANITAQSTSDDTVTLQSFAHEALWDVEVPQNIAITIRNRLTHPGDSLELHSSADIFALPVQASWGSTKAAVQKALELKPKIIIPIHDFHWKDDFRKLMYQRLETFFSKQNIQFKGVETGTVIEV